MVSMVTYDNCKNELDELKCISKEIIAKWSEDQWIMECFSSLKDMEAFVNEKPLIDLILYDVNEKDALHYLLTLRKDYQKAQIMILADIDMSPMEYMKPRIHADSLLLRPWTRKQAISVLQEFLLEYLRMIEQQKNGGIGRYIIDSQEGTLSIPYDQIYYFEAREKKVYVSAGKEEFGFYKTLDKLSEELPEQFIRCHRGFIVNKDKIRKIMLSKNIIYLENGFDVPLSRSYKSVLKGFGK